MPGLARLRASLLALIGLAAALALALVLVAGPSSAAEPDCPASNPPNTLTIVAGSPQTAQLEKPFQTNLQVALANSSGCPPTGQLGGISVAFSAPANGASGTFADSGTNTVTVGTDAAGVATAPTFTTNDNAGSYSVRADSDYGSVTLSLTNTAVGVPASITAVGQTAQAAAVNGQYGRPLQAQVLDAGGHPVQGASVTFSLGTGASGAGARFVGGEAQATETTKANGRATSPRFVANKTAGRCSASARFVGGEAQATETTKANGQATSPRLVANKTAGRFSATAATAGIRSSVTYRLRNLAGSPAMISAGAASGQSAPAGARFPIRLAVTVTDANDNPVAGAAVTFRAPARGPTGRFSLRPRARGQLGGAARRRSRARTRRIVRVPTEANGVAIAPVFTAGRAPGGYVVIATAGRRRAAFALVNLRR